MIPTLLITFREVIEASLIVATMLGILTKLHQKESIKTVWIAAASALVISFFLVFGGSTVGIQVQKLYAGKYEPAIEGILFITSAFFVTWAVFVLHKHFARQKMHLLQHMKETIARRQRTGIFILAFTAVLREGMEIVLFLSTMYVTTSQPAIMSGFVTGIVAGLAASWMLFSATVRLPVRTAFRFTSFLLIIFAGGLLARGLGEFLELTSVPNFSTLTFAFLPDSSTLFGGMIETIFGISRSMHPLQLVSYSLYIYIMHWWVFVKQQSQQDHI